MITRRGMCIRDRGWGVFCGPLFLFVLDSSLPTRLYSSLCASLRFFPPCFPRKLLSLLLLDPSLSLSLSLFGSPWVAPFLSIPLQLERPFLAWIHPLRASLDSSLLTSLGFFSLCPSPWSFQFDSSWNNPSSRPSVASPLFTHLNC